MRRHVLTRFAPTPDGVFGRFERWVTVEEENMGNRPHVSCIPVSAPGKPYICRRTMYHKGGYETFEVTGVPGRDRILFHVANTEEDVEGCIGPGLRMGVLRVVDEDTHQPTHKLAVLSSKAAFKEFMEYFKDVDTWELVVQEYKWAA